MVLRESTVLFFNTSPKYLAGKLIHTKIKLNKTAACLSMSPTVHQLVFNGFSSVQLENSSSQ